MGLFFYFFVQDIATYWSLLAMLLCASIYYVPMGIEAKTLARGAIINSAILVTLWVWPRWASRYAMRRDRAPD